MSSSVAGLPSDSSTVGTKRNGAGELTEGTSSTRLSNSFSTSHSTNGRERTPIASTRRSPERLRPTRSPHLQRRKPIASDFDTRSKQPTNGGNADSDSEAETVVPSPEKRRIQRKRSRSLSPLSRSKSKRKVIETGPEVRKRRIEGEDATQRNEDERLKRLRKDERTNGPIDNRKLSVQRIKRDYEAYSSDLSSAPSSPPPGSKMKSKRLLYSRSRRRSSDSSSEDDEDEDDHSAIESSVTARSSIGANGRNNGNEGSSRLGNKATQAPDLGPSRTRLRRPPPLKPPPRESESSRESSPTYRTHTRNGSSLNTPAAAMPKKDGDAMGRTALHKACQRGKLEDAQKAYELKPSLLNQTDNAGYVPLHEAALNGKANCVKYLLEVGCKVDPLGGQDKDTPLMDAVENRHVDVVELLLEAGADPRLRDVKGRNALDLAKGLDENTDDEEEGVRHKLITMIRSSMEKLRGTGKKSNDERRQSVADSASSRDQSVASPVHQSYPEIQTGAMGRRRARTGKDILWLEGGKMGLAHLKKFARKGELEKVSIMLEQAITPDEEILKEAIKGGHEDVVSILLAYGAPADPLAGIKQTDSKNPDGLLDPEATPMLVCIGRGNLKILQLILNSVNPRWKDRKGRTYMDIAREREGENYEEEITMLQRAWDQSEVKGSNGIKEESSSRGRATEKQDRSKRKRSSPARKSTKSKLPSKPSKSSRHANSDDSSSDETTSGLPKASHAESEDNSKSKKKKKERSPSPDEVSSSPVVRKRRRLVSAGGREVNRKNQIPEDSDEEMVNVDKVDKKKPVKTEKRVKSAPVEEPAAKAPALRSATTSKVKIKKEETPEPKVATRKRVPEIPVPVPTEKPSKREQKQVKTETKEASTTAPKIKKEKDVDTETDAKKEKKRERLAEKEDRRNAEETTKKSSRTSELKSKEGSSVRRDSVSKSSTSTTSSKTKEAESAKSVVLKRLNVPVPEPKLTAKSPTPSTSTSSRQKENLKEVKKERSAAPTVERSESEQVQSDKEKAAAEKAAVEKAERKLRRREEQRRLKAEEERKAEESKRQKEEAELKVEEEKRKEEIERNRIEYLAQELAQTLEKAKADSEKSHAEQEKEREQFLAEQERKMQEERRQKEEAEEARRKAEEEEARAEAARLEAERNAEQARLAEEARIDALPETLQQLARQGDGEIWTLDDHRRWCTPFTVSLLQGATEVTEESLKAAYGKYSEQEKWVLNTQVALALGVKDLSLKKFDQFITARLPATRDILSRVWRMASMDYCDDMDALPTDRKVILDYHANKELQRTKFEALADAFFIKLDDLRQIVRQNPEYAELANQKLCTQGMVLFDEVIPANENPWEVVRPQTPPAEDVMW